MSKAILVLELDDEWLDRINITCDKILADVTLYKKVSLEKQCDYSQRIYRCWCPLKPMPKGKEELYYPRSEYEIAVNEGYNKCIDELLEE